MIDLSLKFACGPSSPVSSPVDPKVATSFDTFNAVMQQEWPTPKANHLTGDDGAVDASVWRDTEVSFAASWQLIMPLAALRDQAAGRPVPVGAAPISGWASPQPQPGEKAVFAAATAPEKPLPGGTATEHPYVLAAAVSALFVAQPLSVGIADRAGQPRGVANAVFLHDPGGDSDTGLRGQGPSNDLMLSSGPTNPSSDKPPVKAEPFGIDSRVERRGQTRFDRFAHPAALPASGEKQPVLPKTVAGNGIMAVRIDPAIPSDTTSDFSTSSRKVARFSVTPDAPHDARPAAPALASETAARLAPLALAYSRQTAGPVAPPAAAAESTTMEPDVPFASGLPDPAPPAPVSAVTKPQPQAPTPVNMRINVVSDARSQPDLAAPLARAAVPVLPQSLILPPPVELTVRQIPRFQHAVALTGPDLRNPALPQKGKVSADPALPYSPTAAGPAGVKIDAQAPRLSFALVPDESQPARRPDGSSIGVQTSRYRTGLPTETPATILLPSERQIQRVAALPPMPTNAAPKGATVVAAKAESVVTEAAQRKFQTELKLAFVPAKPDFQNSSDASSNAARLAGASAAMGGLPQHHASPVRETAVPVFTEGVSPGDSTTDQADIPPPASPPDPDQGAPIAVPAVLPPDSPMQTPLPLAQIAVNLPATPAASHGVTRKPLGPALVELAQNAAGGSFDLALAPEELGNLRMTMVQDGDLVRIVLTAERPETIDLMRRHAEQLSQEFRQAGFSGASLSFGQWGGNGAPPAPQPTDRSAPVRAEPAFSPAPPPAASMSAQSAASLDLRL